MTDEITTNCVLLCDCFILEKCETFPILWGKHDCFFRTRSCIFATLRFRDKIMNASFRGRHWTFPDPRARRCDLHDQPARNGCVSTEFDLLEPMCTRSRGARICARRKFCLFIGKTSRDGAWPSCTLVKPSASSLSCFPPQPSVQRPGRCDKGLLQRSSTCSPMFINKPRRFCWARKSGSRRRW